MGLSPEHFLPSLKVMARGTLSFWDIRSPHTRVLSEQVILTSTDIIRGGVKRVSFIPVHWCTFPLSSPLFCSVHQPTCHGWATDCRIEDVPGVTATTELSTGNHSPYENSTSSSYPNAAELQKKKKFNLCTTFSICPLLIAVSTKIGPRGLRALFPYHVIILYARASPD